MLKRILLIITFCSFIFISIGATIPSDSNIYQYQFIKTTYRDNLEIKNIISSIEDLKLFYENYQELLYLEHREKVYSNSTIGFIDAIEKYDEEYFKVNNLIIIYLTESSGSIRHDIKDIIIKDNTLDINIIKKSTGYGTCDMAGWLLILEVENTSNIMKINYS